MAQLCTGRAIAGISGGGMNAVVGILLSDLVPLKNHEHPLGASQSIQSVGDAVYFVLELPPVQLDHWLAKVRKVDFLSAFALVAAVVALFLALDSESNIGWSNIITAITIFLTSMLLASKGISTGSAVLYLFLGVQLAARLPSGEEAHDIEEKARQSPEYIKELPPDLADQVRSSYQMTGLAPLAVNFVSRGITFVDVMD
ncbi:multidrug resistance [Fusarium beomiforme]|uniref:Multidrug resistance n=1 Tax=Fusarium beomiforme TaxID=44412 RepID=A0A9P5DXN1_9HYPO|nr:multidrug resistance [Fusarium beomiforme]